jgi:hypothetical protein
MVTAGSKQGADCMKSIATPAILFALAFLNTGPAGADTWHFDFTSPPGSGFFDVDTTTFSIPISAASPTSFWVTAADLHINSALFGVNYDLHYTASNVVDSSCTPAECRVAFEIKSLGTVLGTYDIFLQLNFDRIWVPWITGDQRSIQMWQHTNPFVDTIAWNGVGSGQRTVLVSDPAAVPIPNVGAGLPGLVVAFGLLTWWRRRQLTA